MTTELKKIEVNKLVENYDGVFDFDIEQDKDSPDVKAYLEKSEKALKEAADLYANWWNDEEDGEKKKNRFYDAINEVFGGKKIPWMLFELIGTVDFVRIMAKIRKLEEEARRKGEYDDMKYIHETCRLGDFHGPKEYEIHEFCRVYNAELVGEKIKVTPPITVLETTLEKYVNKHRQQIIDYLSGKCKDIIIEKTNKEE